MAKGYLSHYIRGPKGLHATREDMDKNRAMASLVAKRLEILVPKLELYVPADNDQFVDFGYRAGLLSEDLILDVDCHIIDQLDYVLFHDPCNCMFESRGMKREYEHTIETGKPFIIFGDITPHLMYELEALIQEVEQTRL